MTGGPRRVVLDELDGDGITLSLSTGQAEALVETKLVSVRPERSQWRVWPAGRVGSAVVEDLQVDVLPKDKVGLGGLIFLLGYARDPAFRAGEVRGATTEDLWPALAETLARLTRAAVGPGVLQGYRTTDEALRTVRGRIRVGDQLRRHPGRMVPVEVTYDEFTVDIAENQILRTALRRMLAVPRLRDDARRTLGHLDGRLEGVRVLRPGEPLPHWRATRLNSRYAPALRLAEVVLANVSADVGPGHQRLASFAVDMTRVYEDFVGTALREALAGRPGITSLQYPTRLDEAEQPLSPGIVMSVDVVHRVDGRPRLIFDAKYKAASSSGGYPNADQYQMLAYCTALRVPVAWLVYAGPGRPHRRRIRNTDISIVEYPLDLSNEPRTVLANVQALAEEAWTEMLGRTPAAAPYRVPKLAPR